MYPRSPECSMNCKIYDLKKGNRQKRSALPSHLQLFLSSIFTSHRTQFITLVMWDTMSSFFMTGSILLWRYGRVERTFVRRSLDICFPATHQIQLMEKRRLGNGTIKRNLGPVQTSVISSVELAAETHVTVPHSFICVREFASV
jgi:hypothetical protein